MKNLYKVTLAFFFLYAPLHAELSIKNIEKMVSEIKGKRKSKITNKNVSVSPFVVIRKQDSNSSKSKAVSIVKAPIKFSLGAIVNSSAFINGKWYREGDKVGEFTLNELTPDRVVLKKDNRKITLFFKKTKNLLKISEE